jgi:diguanylate cyclase (GGDEF)-like protein/PAS domain S-box-containing protein
MGVMEDVAQGSTGLSVRMTRDGVGIITSVEDSVFDLLGWRPDQMIGSSSMQFIHSEDQAAAVAAWVKMIEAGQGEGFWRGRYRSAYGTWVWVETANRYEGSEGSGTPIVHTTMQGASVEQVSMEERLYARGQLLSRLSDALPVGVFQIDLSGRITFHNDRLHAICGSRVEGTIEEQMAGVVDEDRPLFRATLAAALADRPVDDIEIRLRLADGLGERVCSLALRSLTDSAGVISGVVGCVSDVTEGALLRRELEIRASTDQLTSCLNRAATLDLVGRTMTSCRHEQGHAVVFIDLDRFKSVNDDLGHAAGDQLLVEAADRLRLAIREGDQLGRLGGDEFLVVCPDVANPDQACEIAVRIANALRATVDLGSGPVELRASVGVAWTSDALDADTLIARADSAMYESKRLGAQGVTLFAGRRSNSRSHSHPVAV